jgi:phosphatidylglycerophosphatase A
MKPDRKFLMQHPAHFLALGFGSGLAPRAPGTFGTLAALPLWWLAERVGGSMAVVAIAAVLFFVGIWASERTSRALGVQDHGSLVIDEIAAFLLVLAATPTGAAWVVFAFVLFRLFDIWKPWPIRVADRHVKGGFGVMLDDLLAAVYAVLVLIAVQTLMVSR